LEKKDDKIDIATTVLTPSQDKKANYEVFTGEGKTLADAVSNVSLTIGKNMGFAQCEILALGENICDTGVMSTLDYLTRTKKVDRNATLVTFTGEAKDFAQVVSDVSDKKSLKLETIINYDQRYIIAQDSSIETFYKGYYSDISLGIIPKLEVKNEESPDAIEVQGQSSGTGSEAGQMPQTQSKKYLLNDGKTLAFKNGKKAVEIDVDTIKKVNLFLKDSKNGNVTVENVNDDLYSDASIVFSFVNKKLDTKSSFKNGVPKYDISFEAEFIIDEVIQENPTPEFLKRNKDFFTKEAVRRLKEQIKDDLEETIAYCVAHNVDLIDVYRTFHHKNYKEFEKYLKERKENYLDGIDYEISVKVTTAY